MQEKKENQIPAAVDALVPEIYMPRLQFFIRMLLGTTAAVYFNYIPIPLLILTTTQINLIILSFFMFPILRFMSSGGGITRGMARKIS